MEYKKLAGDWVQGLQGIYKISWREGTGSTGKINNSWRQGTGNSGNIKNSWKQGTGNTANIKTAGSRVMVIQRETGYGEYME